MCVYVCVYVYVSVCVCSVGERPLEIHTGTRVQDISLCVYVCMCVCVCIYVCLCVYVYMCVKDIYVCVYLQRVHGLSRLLLELLRFVCMCM